MNGIYTTLTITTVNVNNQAGICSIGESCVTCKVNVRQRCLPVAISKPTKLVCDNAHERWTNSSAVDEIFDHATHEQIHVVYSHKTQPVSEFSAYVHSACIRHRLKLITIYSFPAFFYFCSCCVWTTDFETPSWTTLPKKETRKCGNCDALQLEVGPYRL